MKFPLRRLHRSPLVLLLVLSACEKPKQRISVEAQGIAVEKTAAADLGAPVPAPSIAPSVPPALRESAAEDQNRPSSLPDPEPELSVAMEGKRIVVTGALRSKIQVERILEALSREFPQHEVESSLVVDYDRMGVGWGNRVADEFLVPFLQRVANAKVAYLDTVVTLEGEVKNPGDVQMISEMAVTVFSGSTTQDLKNHLKVSVTAEP